MKCKICSNNGIFLDDYRFNINYDKKYFGNDLKIYHCEKCDFGFCGPMPEVNKLDSFYSDIYRSPGRPHESQLDADAFRDQILNYIQYLSTFIDFNKIKNVFDFGAGVGDLGYALKKRFNHINLSTIESDSYVKSILRNRSYNVFENFNQIDVSFDLIISTHCFEHLTDLEIIKDLKNISHQSTYLFIEIPNNNFGELFLKRPYDSPHLLFFTLYWNGQIEFTALLVSSIVQDGHGLVPLLASSRRDFLRVKFINTVIALLVIIVLTSFKSVV